MVFSDLSGVCGLVTSVQSGQKSSSDVRAATGRSAPGANELKLPHHVRAACEAKDSFMCAGVNV